MKKIIFLIFSTLFFISCGDENPRYTVPRSPVYFLINISLQDKDLNAGGGFKKFTAARLSKEQVGFGGLFVVNSGLLSDAGLPILYAYDLACPKEDSREFKVEPQTGGVTAICKNCKSEYSILLGTGHVMSGPSKEPLQQYRVVATNSHGEYRITNY